MATIGLFSVLSGRNETSETDASAESGETGDDRTPRERLRERYVDGELTDDEFERQLELLMEPDDLLETEPDDILESVRAH